MHKPGNTIIHQAVKFSLPSLISDPQVVTVGGTPIPINDSADSMRIAFAMPNEIDTNTAYERINNHEDKWPDSLDTLQAGLADEKKHKAWLDSVLVR